MNASPNIIGPDSSPTRFEDCLACGNNRRALWGAVDSESCAVFLGEGREEGDTTEMEEEERKGAQVKPLWLTSSSVITTCLEKKKDVLETARIVRAKKTELEEEKQEKSYT